MPADFLSFAHACDAAAATTSKLRKGTLVAEYLRGLDEEDLPPAVGYFLGRPFAATDPRVLGVGGALVSALLLDLLKLDPRRYHDLVVASGEIGEAAAKVWPTGGPGAQEGGMLGPAPSALPLQLRDLGQGFDQIAATGIIEHKRRVLEVLLRRCTEARQAAYLLKIVLGEPRTGVQEGVLQAGVAQAFEYKLAEIQRAQLLVGNLGQVALLAKRRALETAKFQLFHPIQFMLAAPQETPAEAAGALAGRSHFIEDKLDGIRAHVHKSGNRVMIYTRTLSRAEEAFPDVVEAIRGVPGEFLLDGEIVPWCDGCVMPFAHIQRRLGRKKLTAAVLRENPLAFIAFDILYHDGRLLMDEALRERREALSALCLACASGTPLLTTSPVEASTEAEIAALFEQARARRNEGVVLKDPQSRYTPGRRGSAWLKLKTHLPTLDCVVTAAEFGNGKRRSVLSDYTFAVWDSNPAAADAKLVNIGKAYSGVTDEEIRQLTEVFLGLSRRQIGRVHIVEPKVVLEIAFDQIQKSNRHASGYALRFPRIKRIRSDKRIEDADRLERVAQLYHDPANTARGDAQIEPHRPEPTLFDGL